MRTANAVTAALAAYIAASAAVAADQLTKAKCKLQDGLVACFLANEGDEPATAVTINMVATTSSGRELTGTRTLHPTAGLMPGEIIAASFVSPFELEAGETILTLSSDTSPATE